MSIQTKNAFSKKVLGEEILSDELFPILSLANIFPGFQ
jgi:hypothetical protein